MVKQRFIEYYWHKARRKSGSVQWCLETFFLGSLGLAYSPLLGISVAWTHGLHIHLATWSGHGVCSEACDSAFPLPALVTGGRCSSFIFPPYDHLAVLGSRIWSSGQTQISLWKYSVRNSFEPTSACFLLVLLEKLGLHRIPLVCMSFEN